MKSLLHKLLPLALCASAVCTVHAAGERTPIPRGGPIPGASPIALPPQISPIQPGTVQQMRPMKELPNPQLGPCVVPVEQFVDIHLVAQEVGPLAVQLTWSGPPGQYEILERHVVVSVGPTPTLDKTQGFSPINPVAGQPGATQASYLDARPQSALMPDTRYTYTVKANLPDGKIACGTAAVQTLPLQVAGANGTYYMPNDVRLGFALPPFAQGINIYQENLANGRRNLVYQETLPTANGAQTVFAATERAFGAKRFDTRKLIRFPGLPFMSNNVNQPIVYMFTVEAVWLDAFGKAGKTVATPPVLVNGPVPLWGWTDLHTHPMSNLAFGGRLFHGAPDAGSLLPSVQMPGEKACRFDVPATSIADALSEDAATHGDPGMSACGSYTRNLLITQGLEGLAPDAMKQPGHAAGAPAFADWPRWNDITHQKMWWEWIQRAHQGGLRVLVALSHNNRTLGDAVGPGNFTPSRPGSPISGPTDDVRSSELQIMEIKAFVLRHSDFMQVARSSQELYDIVMAGKLAVILGVEIDNIGNFNPNAPVSPNQIDKEINGLFAQGVRYIFPVHVSDNAFGDTAIYDPLFNLANLKETNSFWEVQCAVLPDEVGFSSMNVVIPAPFDKLVPKGTQMPQSPPCMSNGMFLGHINGRTQADPTHPAGLTASGITAIRIMMKLGMIVDVDHLSTRAVDSALQLAESVPGGGYPLMSGHSGIRDRTTELKAENSRTRLQLERIACLHGMFGLGTDGADAWEWGKEYVQAFSAMQQAFSTTSPCPNRNESFGPGSVAFGTDTNSLVKTPRPTFGPELKSGAIARNGLYSVPGFPQSPSSTVAKVWDYNKDGVAHYGMFADFVKDVKNAPNPPGMASAALVDGHLFRSADYFWRTWQKIEAQRVNVR